MTEEGFGLDKIRTDYLKGSLLENEAGSDPILLFDKWLNDAMTAKVMEVNAMMISTIDKNNKPHSRTVLLKGIHEGELHFYTNYNSAKGNQITQNPFVAALFFWKELERQIRVEGRVEKLSAAESDQYFDSRPIGSRISAIASPQSQIIPNREFLENRVKELEQEDPKLIKRPDNWGGFKIIPDYLEFWQGRHSRLHDRIIFKKSVGGGWERHRIAP